uniref:Uncharacterized protein n=1 Tax=Panagrolaimus sp. ES5 TaxID=591445 RepID=A0AC34FMV4_9BILA
MVDVYKRFIKNKALQAVDCFDMNLATSQFLWSYRTTANPATPGNCTTAKAHLGRQLRTILNLIRPEIATQFDENVKQNESFERHCGTKHRSFKVKDTVFYRFKRESA